MTTNFLILLFVIGLAILFGWLTRRVWGVRNPLLKWIGVILGGLLTLVVGCVSVLGLIGVFKYYNPPSNPAPNILWEHFAWNVTPRPGISP
jgi:hypothetical protein